MCGRYAWNVDTFSEARQVCEIAGLPSPVLGQGWQHAKRSYNVAPSNYGTVYRTNEECGQPELSVMKWGLVVQSTRRPVAQHYKTFNCRQDTLASGTGLWSHVRDRRRCLVLCQGYYEWKACDPSKGRRSRKIPYYVKRKDGHVLALAGLYNSVAPAEPGLTFTIITCEAHTDMNWLHSRIPAILDPHTVPSQNLHAWLDPSVPWSQALNDLLVSVPAATLECYAVSPQVGNVANDLPSLVQPIKSQGIAAMLRTAHRPISKSTDKPETRKGASQTSLQFRQ